MGNLRIIGSFYDRNRRRNCWSHEKQGNAPLAVLEALCSYSGGTMRTTFPLKHSGMLLLFPGGAGYAHGYPAARPDTSGQPMSSSAYETGFEQSWKLTRLCVNLTRPGDKDFPSLEDVFDLLVLLHCPTTGTDGRSFRKKTLDSGLHI